MKLNPSRTACVTAITSALLMAMSAAHAEAPMFTDDAGTMDAGGKKIEGSWNKIGTVRGLALGFGLAPVDNVGLGLALQRARDSSGPTTSNVRGFSAKWIPYKEGGLSAGLKLEWARTSAAGASQSATTITGLATWRPEGGYVVHANLGRSRAAGTGTTNWAIGLEVPVIDKLQATVETFGTSGAGPSKQVGLRWEVRQGLKVSTAIGRAASQNTLFTGFSWEF